MKRHIVHSVYYHIITYTYLTDLLTEYYSVSSVTSVKKQLSKSISFGTQIYILTSITTVSFVWLPLTWYHVRVIHLRDSWFMFVYTYSKSDESKCFCSLNVALKEIKHYTRSGPEDRESLQGFSSVGVCLLPSASIPIPIWRRF